MTSLSPSRAGDDPSPKDISIRSLMPKSFSHTGCPACGQQYTPRDPKKAITWLASTNTEGEAKRPYCAWKPSCGVVTMATFSQSCLPVLRSKASTSNFCSAWGPPPPPYPPPLPPGPGRGGGAGAAGGAAAGALPVGTAVVRKSLSPQITGEECPFPGTSTFQAM